MTRLLLLSLAFITLASCEEDQLTPAFRIMTGDHERLEGNPDYLSSPFVTAGDRVYLVGHQDGSFPELGWHIKGEMGGLWNHPIKLLDGFDLHLSHDNTNLRLNNASKFVNLPFGNYHLFTPGDIPLEISRWQFIPDNIQGMVVEYELHNTDSEPVHLQLEFTAYSDLRPTWLGERTGMQDHSDTASYREESQVWKVKDSLNPWYVIIGSSQKAVRTLHSDSPYQGKGIGVHLMFELTLEPGEKKPVRFFTSGSYRSENDALNTYDHLKSNWPQLLQEKQERYKSIAATSNLEIPDQELETAFRWLKYNADWLVRKVPNIGTGIGAGIPDYPWWFGVDSEYALQGYLTTGRKDIVYSTIELIDSISKATNGNGRIVHEVSTNGAVFNPGNINETPQFVTLIRKVYDWTGDEGFVRNYFPSVENGLTWLMEENDADGNGFPDGFGMMEIHGMDSEMIDVAAYTQRAFADAAYLAEVMGRDSLAGEYLKRATDLKKAINDAFWSASFKSYADFIGTDEQALKLIEDAIVRADTLNKPWAVAELEATRTAILNDPAARPRPFVLHHNWVVNTPMETGIAPADKALQALETAREFTNPFGVFVTGIDRDASAGSDTASFKGSKVFSYTGAVMTLPTGVQAVAENNYGRPEMALDYLKRMTRSFGYALPGSMYEVSPDYGMMTQAWNIYSFAVPIIEQFFGIQPQAAEKILKITPQFPQSWPWARLKEVPLANGTINLDYSYNEGSIRYEITHDLNHWTAELHLPKALFDTPELESGSFEILDSETHWILSTKENNIVLMAKMR